MKRCVVFLLALAGCTGVGPASIPKDRFDYSATIAESWKQQMLLNIVKQRYADIPIFVEVGQIVSGYTVESSINGSALLNQSGNDAFSIGAAARFTDRPTITYSPLIGNQFVKGLMTPITPEALFKLIQADWPADALLYTAVSSINGLRNRKFSARERRGGDEKFFRFLTLVRSMQLAGALGLRLKQQDKEVTTLLMIRRDNVPPEIAAQTAEIMQLLGLNADEKEYKIVFGAVPADATEIAVQSRSLLHIINEFSAHVDVPAEDEAEGRALAGFPREGGIDQGPPLIRIESSTSAPDDAFVSVPYRGRYFYIQDRDFQSKRSLTMLMVFFTLADTESRDQKPLLSISTQ